MYTSTLTNTDIVSVSSLHLAVNIGPDHWQRTRPQPAQVSVQLYLPPSYLNTAGQSDDVADSFHYGHLAKAVEKRVGDRTGGYVSARALLEDVADTAFGFVMEVTRESRKVTGVDLTTEVVPAVRVLLQLPKQILLAGGFEMELVADASVYDSGISPTAATIVRVTNLVLPVLIGVNPPERLTKQRVVTHLTFFEAARQDEDYRIKDFDYPEIIQQVVTRIERSSYLTLERLVYEIIRTAYRASGAQSDSHDNHALMQAITVRCQKPSALSFADASEVEMTRTRASFA